MELSLAFMSERRAVNSIIMKIFAIDWTENPRMLEVMTTPKDP